MKTIPQIDLTEAVVLKPAEMNKIHFGGNHTPLTPEKLKELAECGAASGAPSSTDRD